MTITSIQLVDADLSTNLFDLNDSTGANNSSWGSVATKFGLGGSFKVDALLDAERFKRSSDGAFTTFSRRDLGTASWRQFISASSEANLRLGVSQLVDLVTRGGILRIVTGTTTRYLRFEPSNYPKPFAGKELELHDIYQQFAFRQGLEVEVACQPYWEGAEVTSSAVDVPNNPANGTSGARVFALTGVTGGLPTPAKVRVKIAAESKTLSLSAAADDIIDCTAHGFQVGDAVVFTSLTGGAGLTAGTTYYVISTSFAANTFRIALTPAGTALGFTTDITAGAVQAAGTVERIHISGRPRNTRASTYFSTYLSDTGYFNCESSGRNWTIALSNDTSSTADTEASGGNMARCAHTNDPTAWKRRIHATRTTNLDSLRGTWDVYLRCGPEDIFNFEAQIKWSPSVTDAPPFDLPVVRLADASAGTPQATRYSDVFMGSLNLPDDGTLVGLTVDVWTRQEDLGAAADLDMDLVQFFPHDRQGTVVVPIAGITEFTGADLDSPHDNPAGGTAGTTVGTGLKLDTTTDNAGTRPIAGTVLPAGLYRVTWNINNTDLSSQCDLIVRNVTAAADHFSENVGFGTKGVNTFTRTFVADGTSAYQEQVDNPTIANALTILTIKRERMALLQRDESARTEPGVPRVDRLDSSANLAGYLGSEGVVPIIVDPGDNHIMIRPEEVQQIRMVRGESRLERIGNVTVSYFPRFPF